jgi:hypothetical protein
MTGHTVHTINIIRCAVGNSVCRRTERLCRESELCEERHLLGRKHKKCSAGNICVVAKDLGLNTNIVIMK